MKAAWVKEGYGISFVGSAHVRDGGDGREGRQKHEREKGSFVPKASVVPVDSKPSDLKRLIHKQQYIYIYIRKR